MREIDKRKRQSRKLKKFEIQGKKKEYWNKKRDEERKEEAR